MLNWKMNDEPNRIVCMIENTKTVTTDVEKKFYTFTQHDVSL